MQKLTIKKQVNAQILPLKANTQAIVWLMLSSKTSIGFSLIIKYLCRES